MPSPDYLPVLPPNQTARVISRLQYGLRLQSNVSRLIPLPGTVRSPSMTAEQPSLFYYGIFSGKYPAGQIRHLRCRCHQMTSCYGVDVTVEPIPRLPLVPSINFFICGPNLTLSPFQ